MFIFKITNKMRKNFIVDQGVYLMWDDNYFDLHNNYQFSECNIKPAKRIVILNWLRLEGKWIKPEDPNEIIIVFHNVSFFSISKDLITERIKTIQEIGYKEPDDGDLDWLNGDGNFKATYHIIFRFENDEFIRIHAEFAEVKEGKMS